MVISWNLKNVKWANKEQERKEKLENQIKTEGGKYMNLGRNKEDKIQLW